MKIPSLDFRQWLENKNLKQRTVDEYIYYLNKYLSRFRENNLLTQERVNEFLSEKGNSNPSARGFLVNLQKFIRINYKNLRIAREELWDIIEIELPQRSGSIKTRLIKPLTEEQILEIEKHLAEERDKLKLLMSYYAGLRVGELYKIRIIDFNWEEWKKDMNQIAECRVYGKGNKEGIAFFPPFLMKRIAAFIHAEDFSSLSTYIFMRKVTDINTIKLAGRICGWGKHLKAAAIKAGIIKFDGEGKIIPETNVHPHKLRHSWGYQLRNVKNVDIRDIQEIFRHSSITSTQRYTLVDKAQIKKRLAENVFS